MDPVLIGEILSALMFVGVVGVLLMGFPVAFSLSGTALIFGLVGWFLGVYDPSNFASLAPRYIGLMTNEVLVAVPLFIFMGVILERSGIAEQLLLTMGKLFGNMRGGLGISVVVVRATVEAGNLIANGAIGEVIQTVGLGPHAIRNNQRPDWFFNRERYGGILCDIGSHQFEQFLFFSDAMDAEVLSASVANRAHKDKPGLQDVGDVHLKTPRTTGYIRVDWFTPDGLPTWGDGRLTILGTEGYIELRKYIDIAGRPGTDHLFLVDNKGVRHIDCSGTDLPFGRQFLDDVANRTQTAMPQARCYNAMKLALTAQQMAERGTEWQQ